MLVNYLAVFNDSINKSSNYLSNFLESKNFKRGLLCIGSAAIFSIGFYTNETINRIRYYRGSFHTILSHTPYQQMEPAHTRQFIDWLPELNNRKHIILSQDVPQRIITKKQITDFTADHQAKLLLSKSTKVNLHNPLEHLTNFHKRFSNLEAMEYLAKVGISNTPVISKSLPQKEVVVVDKGPVTYKEQFNKGDTLNKILRKSGIDKTASHLIANLANENYNLSKIQAGQEISIIVENHNGKVLLKQLMMPLDLKGNLEIKLVDAKAPNHKRSYKAILTTAGLREALKVVRGKVEDNVMFSLVKSGIPKGVASSLVNDINKAGVNAKSLKKGDRFALAYNVMENTNTGKQKVKDVVYLNIAKDREAPIKLYKFENNNFYNSSGEALQKKSLLEMPIRFARLSSKFGVRVDPFSGARKHHSGIDLLAPQGTPIGAAGEGRVSKMSYFSGYGNYILIEHPSGYSSAYAHLKGFAAGIRVGSYVNKGQIIGYVGKTGRTTGSPHLHFEIHKGKTKVDPLKVHAFIKPKLEGKSLKKFLNHKGFIDNKLRNV